MGLNTLDGDYTHRNGTFTFGSAVKLPAAAVGDGQFDGNSPLATGKQRHRKQHTYRQSNGSAVVSDQQAVHVGYGANGSVVAVRAGIRTAAVGAATVTIDVKKNGTSILTGTISITSSQAAFALVAGSVATAAYVVGDVFEVIVTATAGGGTLPQGLFVDLIFDEDPA